MATQDFASGLAHCSHPEWVTQKPRVSRPASQSILLNSKPPCPTKKSLPNSEPSRKSNGEQEHKENGTGCDDSDGNSKDLMSEGRGYNASLLPSACCGGYGKSSRAVPSLPPIPKSVRASDGAPDSTAVPLPSSQHQEDLEMRPRSGSRSEEKPLKSAELWTLEPVSPVLQHHGVGGVKAAGCLCEPLPLLSQAKEMDHLMVHHPPSDDDLKDSSGKIHVTLCKSAQKKIQERREKELLRMKRVKEREKEKSSQLPTQSVEPGGAAEEVSADFVLPPINETVSIPANTSNAGRERAGAALRKRVNRSSLPSIPTTSQGGSFPRNSSADSLLPIALGSLEPECGSSQEARPFPHPQQELLNALTWLSTDDWQQQMKGLHSIRCLAVCHSEVLLCRLHDVSLAVTAEVNNLRSKVSRFAIFTLGELFRTMKQHMDHEVDEVAQVLLQKMGDSSEFIQKAANLSLGIMSGSVTPARVMTALMANGVQHPNALVRQCAARHLLTVFEQIGAKKLLSGKPVVTDLLVGTLVKLAQDSHPDTRYYGRKMLNILMSHDKFDRYLKESVPSRDLQDVMTRIKQKGIEDHKCESVKDSRKSGKSNLVMGQDNLPSAGGLKAGSDELALPHQPRHTSLRAVERSDQLNELYRLLTAKEFQTRMKGVLLLLNYSKSSSELISTNIVQIFDVFVLRVQDCNKKVKQKALEVLALMVPTLGDALHPVLVSLVGAVTDNLNSKQVGIYAAAVNVLEAFIAHLDNTLLLQAFSHQVRYLSGQALLDVTDHFSVLVASVYPRNPRAIERWVLPVLWFFLGHRVLPLRSGNTRAVVIKLAKSLYRVMGSRLKECATSQPLEVVKNLWEILKLNMQ